MFGASDGAMHAAAAVMRFEGISSMKRLGRSGSPKRLLLTQLTKSCDFARDKATKASRRSS